MTMTPQFLKKSTPRLKSGEFGEDEMHAHKMMNQFYGAHYGIYEIGRELKEALQPKAEVDNG